MNKIDVQITKNVEGIPDGAFYIMQPDVNGNIWFIGDAETTSAYKYDGKSATKYTFDKCYEIQFLNPFVAGPKGEIYFASFYSNSDVDHPTIVCITGEDDVYETICTNLKRDIVTYKMSCAANKIISACKNQFGVYYKLYGVENNCAKPLLREEFELMNDMVTTNSGEILVVGRTQLYFIDLEKSNVVRSFDTDCSSHLNAMIIPAGILLLDYDNNILQLRNDQGELVHTISPLGKTDYPVSTILAQISNNYLELWSVAKIDEETILLVLKERYASRKNFLRTLHLPSMELLPHHFEGKLKGKITSCAFDRNGALWLRQEAKKDTCKIYKITPNNVRIDVHEKLFV